MQGLGDSQEQIPLVGLLDLVKWLEKCQKADDDMTTAL